MKNKHRAINLLIDLIMIPSLLKEEEFDIPSSPDDIKYFMDEDVTKCQLNLYLYMLLSANESEESESYYQKFGDCYDKLSDDKKDFIKRDYLRIIEAQDRNAERQRKKGNDLYE